MAIRFPIRYLYKEEKEKRNRTAFESEGHSPQAMVRRADKLTFFKGKETL